ncbi:MAG TPA: PQQ-dependent sugar dehydrogenase [Nitrosopumilaceae archaeon]|nr:PQQ-dependent sugar dehydrogenase [Nitrosopumilaceae archaeon]
MKFWLFLIFVLSICIILPAYSQPSIKDNDFIVQKYVPGICCSPTTMDFVDKNNILVLEKSSGNVTLIRDGVQQGPILHENVTSIGEQGMLGITHVGTKVYLYFTQSSFNGGPPLGKRIYSYDWNGSALIHKTLVKNFPQTQNYHNGGAMTTDLNGSVYIVLGDAGQYGKLQNHPLGEPNDTGIIYRVAPTGPYYAMGIRNSFGLTVDPVTGKLWDTENGPDFGDEVNIVPPNFNSGWDVIQGPANKTTLFKPNVADDFTGWGVIMGPANKTTLAQLPGYPGYQYHDPQFTWMKTVAPTGIAFVNSPQFEKYKNSVFVGDCNNGNLYRFQLNDNRDGFVFKSPQLADKVVNWGDSMDEIIFGTGFGCMSDVIAGPDGLLYIVSLSDGIIYRIVPNSTTQNLTFDNLIQYLFYFVLLPAIVFAVIYIRKVRKNKLKMNLPS